MIISMIYGLPLHRIANKRSVLRFGGPQWNCSMFSRFFEDRDCMEAIGVEIDKSQKLGRFDREKFDQWLEHVKTRGRKPRLGIDPDESPVKIPA